MLIPKRNIYISLSTAQEDGGNDGVEGMERSVSIWYLLMMAWPLPARTTDVVAAKQDLDSVVSLNISSYPWEMVLKLHSS